MGQRPSDDELVDAVRNGDPVAFAQLVQRHRAWVWRLIATVVRDHAYAEDLTQDVFCRVYQRLVDYSPQGKFVPWLKRIAINRARNFLRDHAREIAAGSHGLDDLHAGTGDFDPQMLLMSRLLQQEVRMALQAVHDEQRQVLVRHYFGGQSIQAIAAALHCPVGTVKSRLFHGRRQLRGALLAQWSDVDHHERSACS